jgi:hemerythrin-like metal-binding protein
MALVTWDQTYSVSVKKMDQQHQKLFALINALYDAMKQRAGNSVLQNTLRELHTYTVTHFRAEEELLRKTSYPGLDRHQAEHRKFVDKVSQFASDLEAGRITISVPLLQFLKDWLTDHIQWTDRSYADHLNASGVR